MLALAGRKRLMGCALDCNSVQVAVYAPDPASMHAVLQTTGPKTVSTRP